MDRVRKHVYGHALLELGLYLYFENHELTPMPPVPTPHHRVYALLLSFLISNSFF